MKQQQSLLGQFSNNEFRQVYPEAKIHVQQGYKSAVIREPLKVGIWIQHSDGSWTNVKCMTL